MMIKNKPDRELLYKLYVVDELSPIEISDMYGCHACTITEWIKNYGIHFRNRKEAHNTKRILKKKCDSVVGDKNPTKRNDIQIKMRKPKYKNDPIKHKEFCDGCAQRASEHHYEAGSNVAKQQGNKIRGENNPAKRPEVGMKISATNKGRIGGFLGKEHTDEFRERLSAMNQDQDYDAGEWTGFVPSDRPHLIDINQCINLNPWFGGCNQHHIMSGVIINIPVDLHKSVWHRMTNGDRKDKNMKEINKLAFKYLLGKL